MIDWLKNLGSRKPWRNDAGLDEPSIERLAEDFTLFDEIQDGLAQRALKFVLDGDDPGVLPELAGRPAVAEKFDLICTQDFRFDETKSIRRRLFRELRRPDPQFLRRLGHVYEAVSRSLTRRLGHSFGDPKLDWLEMLLIEMTRATLNCWPARCMDCPALTAEVIEAMLQAEGEPGHLLIRTAFQPERTPHTMPALEAVFKKLRGLADSAVRHRDTLLSLLDNPDFKQRLHTLEMMQECRVPAEPFAEKLVALAVSSSKQVREQAETLLVKARPAAVPFLERVVAEGGNDERLLAVRLLWKWQGEGARAFLEARRVDEQNRKVAQAIEELLAGPPTIETPPTPRTELPPVPPVAVEAPLGPETLAALRACVETANAAILANWPTAARPKEKPPLITEAQTDRAFALLQNLVLTADQARIRLQRQSRPFAEWHPLALQHWEPGPWKPLQEFIRRPELQLIHAVRFLYLTQSILLSEDSGDYCGPQFEPLLEAYRSKHPFDLRELAAAFAAIGLDPDLPGLMRLRRWGWQGTTAFNWAPDAVWPYFAERPHLLTKVFEPTNDYFARDRRKNAFAVMAMFPVAPPALAPLLWELALGPKTERLPAQRCLEREPDRLLRLLAALGRGQAEVRIAVADWLGRLRDPAASEPLLAAMKKEKNEAAKGAMMSALENLGVPVEQFLDRDALRKDALKGVAKGLPAGLQWFPFPSLPPVHWADNGRLVEREVLQWLLLQSFKLKNPEPGPLLRRYAASFKPAEREALGQFVLEAWMAEDTAPISQAEAVKRATQTAQQYVQFAQQYPQHFPQKTFQQFYDEFLPGVLKTCQGSAIASKGILAVAGACAGATATPIVRRFLKDWYGMRGAQCRALLQMLVWIEHPTAIQLLLAVGTRFRTRGIQEEANKQAAALAERKGWTLDELADRTIPSAGFDENGEMEFNYGARTFTARLGENFAITLANDEGRTLNALPDARQGEDEAQVKEAKKLFSASKKELKTVLQMQRERLYEAMCTQRTWSFADWQMYLNRHPILRHYCQRLVWLILRDDKPALSFRPLADGSLTDAADDPVQAQPEDPVQLAHECHCPAGAPAAWLRHFADYSIEPLFEQFGRPQFDLTEARKQESELRDCEGHLLEAFKLRGKATKLGYTRGQAQDGGWFYDYHKRFPTLGLEAILEFTGNSLPEENRTVALRHLSFQRIVAGEGTMFGGGTKVPLGEIPRVLLTECWNDLRSIASEGTGFDPEWEKKAQM